MKIFLLFGCLIFWLVLHSQPEAVPGSRAYGIKSGKIVYHFNNLMQEGTTTVIFDDSGRYVKTITEAHLIVDKAGFAAMDSNMAFEGFGRRGDRWLRPRVFLAPS